MTINPEANAIKREEFAQRVAGSVWCGDERFPLPPRPVAGRVCGVSAARAGRESNLRSEWLAARVQQWREVIVSESQQSVAGFVVLMAVALGCIAVDAARHACIIQTPDLAGVVRQWLSPSGSPTPIEEAE